MGKDRPKPGSGKKGSKDAPFHNPFRELKSLLEKAASSPGKGEVPAKARPGDVFGPAMADDDEEELSALEELVAGRARVEFRLTDEYMEGAVAGTSPAILENLSQGRYSFQDFIDLHGLTADEAAKELFDFLYESYALNLRCVLVVHGRGLSSEKGPVLKNVVAETLTRGPGKRMVLAFATARPVDGGPGATYVLLRKSQGKGVFQR